MVRGDPHRGSSNDGPPETRAEFENALRALLVDAHVRGVSIVGGVDVHGADETAWSVEITELAARSDPTEE